MTPQPLTSCGITLEDVRFGDAAMRERPELAALAMDVIASWSVVEHDFAWILSSVLKSDFHVTFSMLAELTGESAWAALRAGVKAATNPEDFDLFEEVLGTTRGIRRRRNEYAHGLWGYVPKDPDVLLLMDARYFTRYVGEDERYISETLEWVEGRTSTPLEPPSPHPGLDESQIRVYTADDFKSDLSRARRASRLARLLGGILRGRDADGEARAAIEADLAAHRPGSPGRSS